MRRSSVNTSYAANTVQNEQNAILNQCLAYEVLRNPDDWLGMPSTEALQALLTGAEDRAGFTRADLPEWRIAGPLDQAGFYAPLVEATGHPTLSIRWATALELVHFSMRDAITDLRDRVEAWAADFDPSSSPPSHFSPPAGSVREHLGNLAARPALYLGRNSSWRLYCYLNGLDRGGDWLGLPPLPVAREIFSEMQNQSAAHYGSRFGAFRVYENSPAELLAWVGVTPSPPTAA
jgi:hypothetical protein